MSHRVLKNMSAQLRLKYLRDWHMFKVKIEKYKPSQNEQHKIKDIRDIFGQVKRKIIFYLASWTDGHQVHYGARETRS